MDKQPVNCRLLGHAMQDASKIMDFFDTHPGKKEYLFLFSHQLPEEEHEKFLKGYEKKLNKFFHVFCQGSFWISNHSHLSFTDRIEIEIQIMRS